MGSVKGRLMPMCKKCGKRHWMAVAGRAVPCSQGEYWRERDAQLQEKLRRESEPVVAMRATRLLEHNTLRGITMADGTVILRRQRVEE